MARVPAPASIVPQIRVVGPPFKNAELMVKLIPVHEDKTVKPKATAGFNERYLFYLFSQRHSTIEIRWV